MMCLCCFGAKKQWFIKKPGDVEGKLQPATTTHALKNRKLCFPTENGRCSGTGIIADWREEALLDRLDKFSWIIWLCCGSNSQEAAIKHKWKREKISKSASEAGGSLSLRCWIGVFLCWEHCYDEEEAEEVWWCPTVGTDLQLLHFLCWDHASFYQ